MSVLEQIEKEFMIAKQDFAEANTPEMLETIRLRYLGRTGLLKEWMTKIKDVQKDQKSFFGKRLNEIKAELEDLLETQKKKFINIKTDPLPDPTLPGIFREFGTIHPLTQTIGKVVAIFERLGFSVVDGPEIEDEFHNFDALNIPKDHPAREMADTFSLSDSGILRSQTSTVQIRVMNSQKPPLRIIAPGRVYRPDTVDATHHYGFSQIEGLVVDEQLSFADLKGTLALFVKELFGSDIKTRFRPSFFPFTEPSAEVDVTCIFCHGKGCRVCKNYGWIELLGCGMVDPNVFKAVNYDADKYTGYAFGMGVERLTMLTLGIDDIRRFFDGDLRFLKQF